MSRFFQNKTRWLSSVFSCLLAVQLILMARELGRSLDWSGAVGFLSFILSLLAGLVIISTATLFIVKGKAARWIHFLIVGFIFIASVVSVFDGPILETRLLALNSFVVLFGLFLKHPLRLRTLLFLLAAVPFFIFLDRELYFASQICPKYDYVAGFDRLYEQYATDEVRRRTDEACRRVEEAASKIEDLTQREDFKKLCHQFKKEHTIDAVGGFEKAKELLDISILNRFCEKFL